MARPPRRQKIPTDATAQSASLGNPFTALDPGRLPEGPGRPSGDAATDTPKVLKRGRVVLRRETAHRAGKAVVIVGEIPPQIVGQEIDRLAHELKKRCGAGGTVRGREIEIQGEHAPRIRAYLETQGFKVAGV